MESERQKEIIDKALSYASEDPYKGENNNQPLSADFEKEESNLAYQVSIRRQLNS